MRTDTKYMILVGSFAFLTTILILEPWHRLRLVSRLVTPHSPRCHQRSQFDRSPAQLSIPPMPNLLPANLLPDLFGCRSRCSAKVPGANWANGHVQMVKFEGKDAVLVDYQDYH